LTLQEAIAFIRPAITDTDGVWADIGAGTGTFTEALFQLLESGKVIATDKSPHSLYYLKPPGHIEFAIIDADFTKPMHLPEVDGILMANALHYANDHEAVLENVLRHLKPGGTLLLIEYDTDVANPPWVPFPLPLQQAKSLFEKIGLTRTTVINTKASIYRDGIMYALAGIK
jgi:ubiquinone/menaquinone biosynthesis C-methylase UbiE